MNPKNKPLNCEELTLIQFNLGRMFAILIIARDFDRSLSTVCRGLKLNNWYYPMLQTDRNLLDPLRLTETAKFTHFDVPHRSTPVAVSLFIWLLKAFFNCNYINCSGNDTQLNSLRAYFHAFSGVTPR